jgi:DNA-binding NtrC family response regulator
VLLDGTVVVRAPIERARLRVGRAPSCDIVLSGSGIPSFAVSIRDDGQNRYRLQNVAEVVTVNGKRVECDEIPIREGDVIAIGRYKLALKLFSSTNEHADGTQTLTDAGGNDGTAILMHSGKRHPLARYRAFEIGSDPKCDLKIDDGFVSRRHCRIEFDDGRWTLVDLGSKNGTMIDGARISKADLVRSTTIALGTHRLTFEIASSSGSKKSENSDERVFGMVAMSAAMREVIGLIKRYADQQAPVLITGESGCGKELVARALHDQSARRGKPCVTVNCGAIPANLIESELFGHMKGAYTGASIGKPGVFEEAHGGTLFLDELGELPLDLQPTLLRVLEDSVVRRVGGTQSTKVNVRIIAATNANLEQLVSEGRFRADLYYRLMLLTIRLLPLRERPEDIVPLARHFLRIQSPERRILLSKGAEAVLLRHSWPGNARDLFGVLLRSLAAKPGEADATLHARDLQFVDEPKTEQRRVRGLRDGSKLRRIVIALEQAGGNRAEAARSLGVSRGTLYTWMERFGLTA